MCKTPYQILVATRLATTLYKDDISDIVVFDTIANAKVLYEKIKQENTFEQVYIYHCKKYEKRKGLKARIFSLLCRPETVGNAQYDYVFLCNVYDWVENAIIRDLRARTQESVAMYMYEDGFATYSEYYGAFFSKLQTANLLKKWYYRKLYSEYYAMNGLYVFSPDLLDWKPHIPVYEIPKINEAETDYKEAVNTIFGYENMADSYEENVIFFEESYYADNIDIDDITVVSRIAEIFEKSNLLVKIHPRNPVNRFKEMGLKTNTNTEIPWEVIALNIQLHKKTLVTIASGSALTSLVNMASVPQKIIMLMNCEEIPDEKLTPTLQNLRKIASSYPQQVYLPENLEVMTDYILKNYGGVV